MSSPNPSKLSDHLAKFRYTNPSSPSPSPKRRVVVNDEHAHPRKRRLTTPLAEVKTEEPNPDVSDSPRGNPSKKQKLNRTYATPETYAHLKAVPDLLRPGLTVVFCGINPSITSSTKQAPYSHPSNRFWKALHGGGFTDRLYDPQECVYLPERFNIGMTNLVTRPTAEQAELSAKEMRIGALDLLLKIIEHRPGIVCFVGKKIWDEFEFVIRKSAKPATKAWEGEALPLTLSADKEPKTSKASKKSSSSARPAFQWDQPRPYRVAHDSPSGEGLRNTLFWVVPSTSGLVRVQLPEQIEHFRAVRQMSQRIQDGDIDYEMYKQIQLEGVAATVASIQTTMG